MTNAAFKNQQETTQTRLTSYGTLLTPGNTTQKVQYHVREASSRHEQAIGDHPTNAQEPSLNEHLLKSKAPYNSLPAGRETSIKNPKHIFDIFEMPILPSHETTTSSTYSSKLIPDNQTISNSEVPILNDKTPITSKSLPMLPNFNHVQIALQAYYEPYLNIKRVSGDILSLESCYINLAMIGASDQRQRDKEDLKVQAAAFHRMPSYEKISKANMEEPIPLEKLFDKRELRDGRDDAPKMILIQGRAGIGKTTLCKKLVNLHQSGLWRDRFDAVLWLPLRQLKGFGARNIEDLLRKKYFAQCPEQEREVFVSMLAARARNGKVLFILDGLDEILTDTQTVGAVTLEPFLKYLLRQEYVVVTSRPSGVDNSILPKPDLELETTGFSKQNVNDYLRNILKPEDARDVQDFIKRTPSIQSLVNIPVQLDVICYSWDSLYSNEQSTTMTGLYQTMVRKLWCKDAERLQKEVGISLTPQQIQRLSSYQIDKLMATVSEYLSFLAFKGIRDHQIEFDESTLQKAIEELDELQMVNQGHLPYQLLDTLKQTSFLHTADAGLNASKDDSQRAWYFLHLTFQEYFAASWIARHLQIKQRSPKISPAPMMTVEETMAYIQKHKYNPRYQIVWWMVAGLLQGETLVSFFELLQRAPVDLVGGYHHHLLAACLKESRSQLDTSKVGSLEIQLEQWLKLEMMINNSSKGSSILGSMSYFPEELLIRSIGQFGPSRDYLIRTLGMRASLTQSGIEILLNALQDKEERVRNTAAIALGKQSALPESSLQTLVGALQDEYWNAGSSAAEALGKQSTMPESILQALISALQDKNEDVRISAAKTLGRQSTLPESVLHALIGALQDEDV
ncbi:hypothetical protein BGX21_000960, partial [Mortierella sp. AD011]